MIEPTWQTDDGSVVLYRGDCLKILPQLVQGCANVLLTDPVWPNAMAKMAGSDDADGLFAAMWAVCPRSITRAAIHLGFDTDPRFLEHVPWRFPFFRVCWLTFPRVGYKGRKLHTGDVAYLFGEPPPSRPGNHCISGEYRFCDPSSRGKEAAHPCPRKIGHVTWLAEKWTDPSDTILDPFMGSGTTIVASIRTGRRAIGIEIDPAYFDTAVSRVKCELDGVPPAERAAGQLSLLTNLGAADD